MAMGTMASNEGQEKGYNCVVEMISELGDLEFESSWYEIATETHFWLHWRLNAMIAQLKELRLPLERQLRVLDVGCGCGVFRSQIEKATGWIVDGADLNIEALRRAGPGRGRLLFYDVREQRDFLMKAYDVVILYDVLEHIINPSSFISSVLGHIKAGGRLLVNVPAIQLFYSAYDRAMGHVRRYSKGSLAGEFSGFPLLIEDIRFWGFTMLPFLAVRSLIMALKTRSKDRTVELGFKPPHPFADKTLGAMMRLELMLMRKPALGTSLLMVGRKQ